MLKCFFAKKNRNVYLDYAAATPIDAGVSKLMSRMEDGLFANPSAIHSLGVETNRAIQGAREGIAGLINAHADEIVFTGSGTESNALAIMGVVDAYYESIEDTQGTQKNAHKKGITPHIITSAIEHPAVIENCKMLEKSGRAEVTYVGVSERGIVDPKEVKNALRDNTILVSIMYANNEIGTIQPIQEIAKVVRAFNKAHPYRQDLYRSCLLHTDACQAMNYLFTENIEKLGVDLMSWNSSKVYGPKGVGMLFKKRGVALAPIYSGGGQEQGLRSGTENVAGIVAAMRALEKVSWVKASESKRLTQIRDYGIEKLLALSDDSKTNNLNYKIILNGDRANRLPNNINISVSDISSELLVIELSAKGIMVSAKSACKSDDPDESYVIAALNSAQGLTPDSTSGSLRISLGRTTTQSDMDYLVKSLKEILVKYSKYKN
jgi:cysteine desulfurase